jgi:type I restriction enzyme S subunit
MNAQQLRNSILQEAIEGRLVPQDPNDEPASVLLDRIREEKKRLVKEGIIKADKNESSIYRTSDGHWMEHFDDKKKSDVCIDDEITYNIPEHWEICRLNSLAEIVRGGSPRPAGSPEFYEGNIPFLKVADLTKDSSMYVNSHTSTIKEAGLKKTRKVNAGTFMLTNSGATLGVPKICTFDATFNDGIAAFLCLPDFLKSYLYWFLCSKTEAFRNINQGTAQPNLNTDIIKATLFPLPPLAEQKRIVAKIEELLPKVEEYGNAQDALDKLNKELPERLKKSILQEAIEGRLVPQDPNDEPASVLLAKIRKEKEQLVKEGKLKKKDLIETPITDDEIPFEIPESWMWCRVKSILNVYSARRVHEKDWRSSGIPFYRAREIGKLADTGFVDNDLFIDKSLYEEFSKSGVPHAGDLMVTAVGTLGKTYIVKEGEVFYYKDGSVLCFNNQFHMDARFLKYYIESPAFIEQYANESQGTTVATLTMVRVNEYLIPLPPLAEQHRIVEKLEQLLGEIDKLKK